MKRFVGFNRLKVLLVCLLMAAHPPLQAEGDSLAMVWLQKAGQLFQQKPDSALYFLEQAISVFEQTENWDRLANAYNGLVASHIFREDYQAAEKEAIQALSQIEQALGTDHSYYADALNNLGALYRRKGNLDAAMRQYEAAMRIAENSQNLSALSRLYNNMAIIRRRQGEAEIARDYYQQSLEKAIAALGPEHPQLIRVYIALSRVQEELGQYEAGIQSIQTCQKLLNSQTPEQQYRNQIEVYHRLGWFYTTLDQPDSVRYYVQKSERLQEKYGPYRKQIGAELLGQLAQKTGNLQEALKHYQDALQYRKTELKGLIKSPAISNSYQQIGKVWDERFQMDSARSAYYMALEYLSDTSLQSGQLPSAEKILQPYEALAVLEAISDLEQRLYDSTRQIAHWRLAMNACQLAHRCVQRLRRSQQQDIAKLRLSRDYRILYERGIQLSLDQYALSQESQWLEQAFQFSEQSRAMVLYEAFMANQAYQSLGLPDSILHYEQALLSDISFYEGKIQSLAQTSDDRDSEKMKRWQNALFEAQQDYQNLVKRLEQRYPSYYQFRYEDHSIHLGDFQADLKKNGEAVLATFWGRQHAYLFGINADHLQVHTLALDSSLIQEIKNFQQHLVQPPEHTSDYIQWGLLASNLYQYFLAPFEQMFAEQALCIIPDGPLSYIPFECLLTQSPATDFANLSSAELSRRFRSLPYLFAQNASRYAFSAKLMMSQHQHPRSTQRGLIAFAPDYPQGWELSYNQENAKAIAAPYQGSVFLGQGASESHFKQKAADFSILHLAMHAFADPKDTPQPYLWFAATEDSLNDGKLYLHELYNMHLKAELAVLAACETGSGQYESGEGIMSLARAFQYAGCPSLISSLWKADGRATDDMSRYFFTALKAGNAKSIALQSARSEFLKTASPDLTHPYFWANMVLIGQSNSLNSSLSSTYFILLIISLLVILIAGIWKIQQRKKQ